MNIDRLKAFKVKPLPLSKLPPKICMKFNAALRKGRN